LKEEALHRTLWRIRLGRGYGPVARWTKKINAIGKKSWIFSAFLDAFVFSYDK
jgi:hypothetical protein